jgi:anti-anti-sigma regulatory factor
MCTLTPQTSTSGTTILALAGTVDNDSLPEIDRFIRDGRKARHPVALDMSDVTLLDRSAAQFFARQRQRGVELLNCPSYIEPWISREANH